MTARTALTTVPRDFSRAVRLVAIGTSAGGVDALLELLPALPAGLPCAIAVVVHVPQDRDSMLADVFARRCAMRVVEAADKMPIEAGSVYFAPAGYHLLVERDFTLALSCDAPERFSRPSIDALLASAADALGAELAAVVLTGANDDGARGLAHAASQGALTVVQDPAQARVPDMPRAAIARAQPDFILPLAGVRDLLLQLHSVP